jgi:hypothetical protein
MTVNAMTADAIIEEALAYIRRRNRLELVYTGSLYEPTERATLKERNLGGAIFLVAIEDYCSMDDEIHKDARDFLFPATADSEHAFDWAVSLTDELDAGWLQSALKRSRFSWDVQRRERLAVIAERKRVRKERKAHERKAKMERMQAAAAVRGDRVAVQQPCAGDDARAGDTAAHV